MNYESTVDWALMTDHLRCNPSFFGRLRFDAALIQHTTDKMVFVRLLFMFTCQISTFGTFKLALVQLYTLARLGHCLDRDFQLTRVKALPSTSSMFIPLESIIRGAVLVPSDSANEYFVVDHLDSDMFLQMKALLADQKL